jgi:hypothetical protein
MHIFELRAILTWPITMFLLIKCCLWIAYNNTFKISFKLLNSHTWKILIQPLKNSFSPRKSSGNISWTFFSVNFIKICTKRNLGLVYRFFFAFERGEKVTWLVGWEFFHKYRHYNKFAIYPQTYLVTVNKSVGICTANPWV